jgi:excinuclease UvrABC ATPase subunit
MRSHHEASNYINDHRVVAGERGQRFKFDAKAMTLTVELYNGEAEEHEAEFQEFAFPARYAVCPTCRGKGSHVNPSIDAGGITGEELGEWDDDERESYLNGRYDVACYQCGGERLVPEIDKSNLNDAAKAALKRFRKQEREAEECEAMSRAERAMGA